ncbi:MULTISPECIES: helix-turn-helix domain-containing protein [Paraburkholderia]|uniref:helix-turn-helix domain-containing protein n=1 Tax=Paraburkholderia TaxID=1822464 RepID=UPI0032182D11
MKKPSIREILAANLSRLMDAHPVLNTQMRLATRSGVAQRTIGRMKNAEVDPQLGHVEAVADALGVSLTELLTDKSAQSPSLEYDEKSLAELSAEDRAKIQAFIDFILASHRADTADTGTALNFSKTIHPTAAQKEMAGRVAQRQLSNKTLSIDEDQKTPRGGKRGRR